MPERRVPRAFTLPWGRGQILEEASIEEGLHQPAVQLLHYELGEKKGQMAIRFVAYDEDGRLEQRPLIINQREMAALKAEIDRAPRLKALLKRLVEE
jgi:hypothetical protein